LTNSIVSNNRSNGGGGINVVEGTMTLIGSVVSGNQSSGAGGGISSFKPVNILNCLIANNTSSASGGGLQLGSLFTSNVLNTTISGNSSAGIGGGIWVASTINFTNLTIVNNRSDSDNSGGEQGGGIYPQGAHTINNSIIAGNFRGSGLSATADDVAGSLNPVSSFNLIGTGGSGGLLDGVNNNQVGVADPRLKPLGNYGGQTQTMLPLPGSPAINAGNIANLPPDIFDLDGDSNTSELLPVDQRGLPRVVNTNFDIGAVEANYSLVATAGTPQSAMIGSAFGTQLAATVQESGNNTTGVAVTFTSPGSGSSGTFPGNVITSNATTDAGGVAIAPVFTANGTAGGPYNVIASLAGGLSSASFALTNAKGDQSIMISLHAPAGATYNSSLTVAAVANSGLPVSYSSSGSCGNAGATFTMTSGAGTCQVIYGQPGNENYNSAPPLTDSVTAQKAETTMSVSSSINPSDFGQNVTFTATVTSSAGIPTGTIQFRDGPNALGSAVACTAGAGNSCTAQVSSSTLGAGTHNISATYSGDANFLDSLGTLTGGQVVTSSPSLAIDDVSIAEGDNGIRLATFTVTLSAPSSQTVTVNFATADGTAHTIPAPPGITPEGSDYFNKVGGVTFAPMETSKPISVAVIGDLTFEPNETFVVNLSAPANATIADAQGLGTINNDDAQGGKIAFNSPTFNVAEIAGSYLVSVDRRGDTSQAVTVDYATSDLTADGRKDYTPTRGTLQFGVGDAGRNIEILINTDSFVEGNELIQITLSNPTGGAALGVLSSATLQIENTPWSGPPANPIDDAERFVRQHYHDFLNREAANDPDGLAFWTNQITECQQPGATCNAEIRRINVSAAFFLSIEFQETGYLVERMYKSAYGDALGTSTFGSPHQLSVPVIRFDEFLPDTQQIGKNVVVGRTGWEQVLENNKLAFALDFVSRARFGSTYPTTLSPTQFVDMLYVNAGVMPTAGERTSVIAEFGGAPSSADTAARARVLRRVAENPTLVSLEKNRAFVLIQYFGYLRRNPNDPGDTDYTGYDFWLTKLNEFGGNFVNAEMVKAFIVSGEYRERFGPN
jgi:hypothetical protein